MTLREGQCVNYWKLPLKQLALAVACQLFKSIEEGRQVALYLQDVWIGGHDKKYFILEGGY